MSCFPPGKQDTDKANHSQRRNYPVDAKWVGIFLFRCTVCCIFLFRMLSVLAPRHLVHPACPTRKCQLKGLEFHQTPTRLGEHPQNHLAARNFILLRRQSSGRSCWGLLAPRTREGEISSQSWQSPRCHPESQLLLASPL